MITMMADFWRENSNIFFFRIDLLATEMKEKIQFVAKMTVAYLYCK